MVFGTVPKLHVFSDSVVRSSVDVLIALNDDYSQRVARHQLSQYRLSFEDATDNDNAADLTSWGCTLFSLRVTYLVP